MPRKTRKTNVRKPPKKRIGGRSGCDNNATRMVTKFFALCKNFVRPFARRRAEKSHGRLLVRKACSIFDPGGQKSQVRRLVRNRRFERRRRAEKSHSRLLVRKACSIFDPGGQKSQVRQVVRNDARSGTTSAKISQKGGGERESNTDRGVAEVGQYRVESA